MSSKITTLYVDDEPINLMLFEEIFNEKYNVITANSGFEGLDMLKSNPEINVVISDMKMPALDGLEFIRLARKEHPNLVYFIISGYNLTEEIHEAIKNCTILKYFLKPLNIKDIEQAIESAILSG